MLENLSLKLRKVYKNTLLGILVFTFALGASS